MAQPHAVRMHVPMLGNHVEAVFARSLHVSQSRSVGHGSSPKSRWWFRSSRRWQLVLPTPSTCESGRLHPEMGRVTKSSRTISRRSAPQRALERTQPGHTHSHACAAAAHAQNHGHTHVRAGSHTGTRLRSSFNLCQSVMGRSQLPVGRLLPKRHVHGPFGQRAPSQSKSLIPPRRRRKRSPRGLLRRGPRPRRRPRQPSRTRMQRTRAMALQSLRCHPMRVGRPHAVRMHVPTPMLLSTRGRCFARSWHARTHTRTASHCSLSNARWWCVRLSRASPRKGGGQETETRLTAHRSRAVPRRSAPQRTVEHTQSRHTHTFACVRSR